MHASLFAAGQETKSKSFDEAFTRGDVRAAAEHLKKKEFPQKSEIDLRNFVDGNGDSLLACLAKDTMDWTDVRGRTHAAASDTPTNILGFIVTSLRTNRDADTKSPTALQTYLSHTNKQNLNALEVAVCSESHPKNIDFLITTFCYEFSATAPLKIFFETIEHLFACKKIEGVLLLLGVLAKHARNNASTQNLISNRENFLALIGPGLQQYLRENPEQLFQTVLHHPALYPALTHLVFDFSSRMKTGATPLVLALQAQNETVALLVTGQLYKAGAEAKGTPRQAVMATLFAELIHAKNIREAALLLSYWIKELTSRVVDEMVRHINNSTDRNGFKKLLEATDGREWTVAHHLVALADLDTFSYLFNNNIDVRNPKNHSLCCIADIHDEETRASFFYKVLDMPHMRLDFASEDYPVMKTLCEKGNLHLIANRLRTFAKENFILFKTILRRLAQDFPKITLELILTVDRKGHDLVSVALNDEKPDEEFLRVLRDLGYFTHVGEGADNALERAAVQLLPHAFDLILREGASPQANPVLPILALMYERLFNPNRSRFKPIEDEQRLAAREIILQVSRHFDVKDIDYPHKGSPVFCTMVFRDLVPDFYTNLLKRGLPLSDEVFLRPAVVIETLQDLMTLHAKPITEDHAEFNGKNKGAVRDHKELFGKFLADLAAKNPVQVEQILFSDNKEQKWGAVCRPEKSQRKNKNEKFPCSLVIWTFLSGCEEFVQLFLKRGIPQKWHASLVAECDSLQKRGIKVDVKKLQWFRAEIQKVPDPELTHEMKAKFREQETARIDSEAKEKKAHVEQAAREAKMREEQAAREAERNAQRAKRLSTSKGLLQSDQADLMRARSQSSDKRDLRALRAKFVESGGKRDKEVKENKDSVPPVTASKDADTLSATKKIGPAQQSQNRYLLIKTDSFRERTPSGNTRTKITGGVKVLPSIPAVRVPAGASTPAAPVPAAGSAVPSSVVARKV